MLNAIVLSLDIQKPRKLRPDPLPSFVKSSINSSYFVWANIHVKVINEKDTRFSRRRSMAASSSQGRFVAAKTNTSSSDCVKPSICNLIEVNNFWENRSWNLLCFIFKQNFEVQTIPRQYNNTRLPHPLLLNCCSWQCKIVHKDLLHTRKEKNACIRSSVFKRLLASCSLRASPRWLIIASISSRNIVEGAWCLASSNNTLINFSESPAMCSISRYGFHYDRVTNCLKEVGIYSM